MSRELVLKYWCDNKAADHPKRTVEGDTILVYDRTHGEVREIELCDDCLSTITDHQMQEVVSVYGREQTDGVDSMMLVCPVVGCKRSTVPFKDAAGRRRHLTRMHPEFDQD